MPTGRRKRDAWLFSRVCETIEDLGTLLGVGSAAAASAVASRITEAAPKPPTTLLEKETYIAQLDRRRRRLKEFRSGIKRFLAFLFSQIGLSMLVIGYTILGGMLFRAVELENEKAVKIRGREMRNELADQFSGEIIRELRYQLSSYSNEASQYYKPPQPPLKESNSAKPDADFVRSVVRNGQEGRRRLLRVGRNRSRRAALVGCQEQDFARLQRWLQVIAYTLRRKTRQELHSSLRKLVKMMEHDGWNGEDSIDDLKWSWEGSILFAVTVITTIGYGHAVPKTNAGKVLTILYALVGIPLVFLYLTNIGDYLAALFRALYSRVCRRCCEGSCMTRTEQRGGHRRGFNNWNQTTDASTAARPWGSFSGWWQSMRSVDAPARIDSQFSLVSTTLQHPLITPFSHGAPLNPNRSNLCVLRPIASPTPPNEKKHPNDDIVLNCVGINVYCNEQAILADQLKSQLEKESARHETGSKDEIYINSETVPDASYSDVFILQRTEASTSSNQQIPPKDSPLSVRPVGPPVRIRDRSYISMNSHHNESTQTALHARPGKYLSYRDLHKSYITGQYLRSYRREKRHRRRLRRQKLQSEQRLMSFRNNGFNVDNNATYGVNQHQHNNAREYLSPSDIGPLPNNNETNSNSLEISSCKSEVLERKDISVVGNRATNRLQATSHRRPQTLPMEFRQQRSRLSVISSLAGSSNDLTVQLSYFSDDETSFDAEAMSRNLGDSRRQDLASKEDLSKVTVPISLSIIIMTTYILIGAIVFSIWEDSNYLKWSYFCFVTLSTIGFGDIVPGTKVDSTNPQEKLVIITLYVAIGLSVFAMCFKLMQEEVLSKCKWLAHHIGVFKRKVRKQRSTPLQRAQASLKASAQTTAVKTGHDGDKYSRQAGKRAVIPPDTCN